MRRGLFFALLCAVAVGATALALVIASFVRPQLFQSLIFGTQGSGWSLTNNEYGVSNADIVAEANEGVVTVIATRALRSGELALAGNVNPSPDGVQRGTGTGFIIDPEGFIVTNEHVIKDADRIRVRLSDGRERKATVVGTDRATDLALLRIEAENLAALNLGDSDAARVGAPVIAIGNPLEYERSVTSGIISAKGRKVYENEPFEDFIQTDAAINRGNSGGPLLNQAGEVIGVNTVIRSDGRGISFAVPSNVVNRVVAQLRANGFVARGYLGVTPSGLTQELRDGLGLGKVQGILVADVSANTAAARAGIQSYDVVTHFDGRAIRHTDDFFTFVANALPQQQVEIAVIRGGQQIKLHATLDQRPSNDESSPAQIRPASEKSRQKSDLPLGFSVRENTPEVLRELRLGKLSEEITGGVIVSEVDPLGPAADSRLSVGYIILEANRQPIHNLEDFQKVASQLREGGVLVIRYTVPYQRAIRLAAIRVGEG
jgi:serine protease Do